MQISVKLRLNCWSSFQFQKVVILSASPQNHELDRSDCRSLVFVFYFEPYRDELRIYTERRPWVANCHGYLVLLKRRRLYLKGGGYPCTLPVDPPLSRPGASNKFLVSFVETIDDFPDYYINVIRSKKLEKMRVFLASGLASRAVVLTSFFLRFLPVLLCLPVPCPHKHGMLYRVVLKRTRDIREFKLLRWRRRQRRLKNELYFTYESLDTLESFSLLICHCQSYHKTESGAQR